MSQIPNESSKYVRINVVEKVAESLVYGFKNGAISLLDSYRYCLIWQI